MTEIVLTANQNSVSETEIDIGGCLPPIHIHLHFKANPPNNDPLWPTHALCLNLTIQLQNSPAQPLPGGRPHPIPEEPTTGGT